ncbi:MAG TPA: ribonuclease Z [Thermoanaerobaculia bacterium]|nr:ribonuclease Z [Thermoanaerobaculia bacterium]
MRVTFLGTGAGVPTPARNVASLAVVLDGRTLLFDCGEGTQHQLFRSTVKPGSIDAIFITHLHGDHLFGLPGLLASLGMQARTRPLMVYGPRGLHKFLAAVPYLGTPYDVRLTEIAGAGEVLREDGFRVVAAPLEHRIECFGFAVIEDDLPGTFDVDRARALGVPAGPLFGHLQRGESVSIGDRVVEPHEVLGARRAGRRIVYCTDTIRCAAAMELARDADLLIHEATYDDSMAMEARERGHSTAVEAAEVARDAGAKRLVLTHLSSRYTDAAPLLAEARGVFANAELAEDFATFDVPRPRG